MDYKFSHNFKLPKYLEEALAPFSWSGVFSKEFKSSISSIIMSDNIFESVEHFILSVSSLNFLSKSYKRTLFEALRKYAKERNKDARSK